MPRRRASDHLYFPDRQTRLLYKEGPEIACRPWREQPAASPEFFCLRSGVAAAWNLAAGECGVSW